MNKILLILLCFAVFNNANGQEKTEDTKIDASKPTNLYTQVNTVVEYQDYKSGSDLLGTRMSFSLTFDPDNLLYLEVPFFHNSGTDKFGLYDMRVRYYHAAKRNISKSLIAIAPFADITLPTGNHANGLRSNVWTLSGGLIVGIVLSKKASLFPGIGYVHTTKPKDYIGKAQNGVNFQTNISMALNDRLFAYVNPIVTVFDKAYWSSDFTVNYMAKPNKLKLNLSYSPSFTNKMYSLSAGANLYL